jgi:hypothetical protein
VAKVNRAGWQCAVRPCASALVVGFLVAFAGIPACVQQVGSARGALAPGELASVGLASGPDPRLMEIVDVMQFHAIGEPRELLYYAVSGADEAYRLVVDGAPGYRWRLVATLVSAPGGGVLAVRTMRFGWFSEAQECIARRYGEFMHQCQLPKAETEIVLKLSSDQWDDLRRRVEATPLWEERQDGVGASCLGLDGTAIALQGFRDPRSSNIDDCPQGNRALLDLARYIIRLSGADFRL